jgi:transposase
MYYNETVKVPEEAGKINVMKKGKSQYVRYLLETRYVPEKKYAIPKFAIIGKLSDEPGQMFPNENYVRYFGTEGFSEESQSERSGCLKSGTFTVLSELTRELNLKKILKNRFDDKEVGLILDLAFYSIITEGNQAQYYPDYAYNHPLMTENMKIYSDSKISDFLASVDINQIQGFLDDWNCDRDHNERIYISYDSTNKNCQSGDIDMVEYGHPKVDKGLPVVNVSMAYDVNNEIPLFYEGYPGSIVDVSQLRCMVEKASGYGYKNIGFILDRGYFSRANINDMDKARYPFVIMVKGQKKLVSEIILECKGSFENDRSCLIRPYRCYGKTVARVLYPSDTKERYFHLFYSHEKAAAERMAFEDKIEQMQEYLDSHAGEKVTLPETYNKYFNLEYHKDGTLVCAGEKTRVIEKEISLFGYYCIISSEEMSAEEALTLYKSRDASEKLFRGDKSYLGGAAIRVHSGKSMRTKLFIEFIALILRNRMFTKLKKEQKSLKKRLNYMNVPAAIRELEKMELMRCHQGNYILDHAPTKTQKTILKSFGIDANVLKRRNRSLCDMLEQVSK